MHPVLWRCAVTKSSSKQNGRYFLNTGQEPLKREIFKFPTEAAKISNHNQNRQTLALSWGKSRGSTELVEPKPSSLPSQKGGMGKGDKSLQKGTRCPEEKRQRTWDYSCSKTNWLDKWNIMESAKSAPLSVHLSPGCFICPFSSQQNKMKCIFYCKLLYSAGCKRLEDFPRENELTRDCFIL